MAILRDLTPEERLMRRVWKDPECGCWLWQGGVDGGGYGHLSILKRSHRAHRLAYELFVGPIPEGLVIDHLCRVRRCVNPEHLEPVTIGENVRRSPLIWSEEACRNGHPRVPENTRMYGKRRVCLDCLEEQRLSQFIEERRQLGRLRSGAGI